MKLGYPNLELLDYKAREIIQELHPEYTYLDLIADVFIQTWASTALGFDGIGGQAITKAYTTIIGDFDKNIFVVFFDNQVAYTVEYPNEKFFDDILHKSMTNVRKYYSRYKLKEL